MFKLKKIILLFNIYISFYLAEFAYKYIIIINISVLLNEVKHK